MLQLLQNVKIFKFHFGNIDQIIVDLQLNYMKKIKKDFGKLPLFTIHIARNSERNSFS